jgi:hypothetical protein
VALDDLSDAPMLRNDAGLISMIVGMMSANDVSSNIAAMFDYRTEVMIAEVMLRVPFTTYDRIGHTFCISLCPQKFSVFSPIDFSTTGYGFDI